MFAALLIVAAVFVPKPGDLKEPPDMAKLFHPITLITPEGGSYRFLALDEAKKITPVYAVTWSSVATQEITRTFGRGASGVSLGFFHRHARWSYQLADHRFGDWKSAADGPAELAPAERNKLRPLVVAELNRRELYRGARLEQLLGQPVEIDTFICWQNGVVLLAWLALLLAVLALVRWLWATLAGKIMLFSLTGIGLLELWLCWGKAARHGPSDTGPVESVARAARTVPPLGPITSGIGAEFTVPAGPVAILEIVTRKDNATVPVPPHCAYVLAGDQPIKGTFRWSHAPQQDGGAFRRWRIAIVSDAGVGSTGGALPAALDAAVGALGFTLGVLEPNEETFRWGTAAADTLPASGLIGLRITTVAHNLKNSGEGVATTE